MMRSGVIEELWRLARFSIVGATATLVHIGVAMGSVAAAGINPTLASMIGFTTAFLVSYVGHFRFTFAVSGRYQDYLAKFAANAMASLFLSTGAVWVATAILGVDYRPALIALAVIIPVCNYLVNRFWVFLQPGRAPGGPLEVVIPE